MTHYVVTYADILEAHERALTFGGRAGVVNAASLLSAIGRPYSGYHESLAAKATALLHAVVRNHGFVDANKRTALLVSTLLIRRSGYVLRLQDGERFDDVIVAVANGEMAFSALSNWFDARLSEAP